MSDPYRILRPPEANPNARLMERIAALEERVAHAHRSVTPIYGVWSANNATAGVNYFQFGNLRINLSAAAQEYMIEKDANTIEFLRAGTYRIDARAMTYTSPSTTIRQDAGLRRNNSVVQLSLGHSNSAIIPYVLHHFCYIAAFAVGDYVGITNETAAASTYSGGSSWNKLHITHLGL